MSGTGSNILFGVINALAELQEVEITQTNARYQRQQKAREERRQDYWHKW